jgi:ABC-type antimicrobial peptide transport system permease subunit
MFDPSGGGFLTLRGQVVEYNFEEGWYNPVPNALVFLHGKPEPMIYGHRVVLMCNDDGEFVFKGALQSVVQGVLYSTRFYTAQAYKDDPSPGPVEYATDFGQYTPMYTSQVQIDKLENHISIGVFKCGSIALFSCINPFTMSEILASFQVNDVRTHSTPDMWGVISNLREAIIFVPPELSSEIIMEKTVPIQILGVLNNASEIEPNGAGYKVEHGECLYLTETPLRYASRLSQITETYLESSQAQGLRPISVEENNRKAHAYLSQAYEALDKKQYDVFYSQSLQAWSLSIQAYQEIRGFMGDAINTTVFFFVLLIPFAFLSERLFFDYSEGRKRLVASAAIFAVFVVILYIVHPGFHLASNIYMTLMGFVIVVLLSPALAIILGETLKYLGQLRQEIIGKHFTSISRLSALLQTFMIGISYMKRRKLRTALTLLGIILITFSLISFTSVLSFSIVRAKEQSGATLYDGILVRTGSWLPLSEDLPKFFGGDEISPSVHPRSWLYAINDPSTLMLVSTNGSYTPRVILGITSNDPMSTQIDTYLSEGSWFSENQSNACLVSNSAADTLRVKIDDMVALGGLNLIITGIMNETEMRSILDLDQESFMPLHPIQPGTGIDVHTLPEEVAIITYDQTISRGANIYSVALSMNDSESIYDAASRLANVLTEVNVYGGRNELIKYYEKGVGFTFQGWNLILIPLLIAAFIILNSMLSSVHERLREISIYSSVGLSPIHIAGLFLAESIVYAVLGTVFGYTLGMVGYPSLVAFGILPSEIPLNYSSSWVMITLGVCMAVTLLSTIYPMYKASRLVTPSIERSWEIPTKPEGDKWTIPLPFVVTSKKELLGILVFMKEYFEAHTTERAQSVFATRKILYRDKKTIKSLVMEIRLAPFEMGVLQETHINAGLSDKSRYGFELHLQRLGGYLQVWKTSNRKLADEVRKQLLLWRGLKAEDRESYMSRASELKKIREEPVGEKDEI